MQTVLIGGVPKILRHVPLVRHPCTRHENPPTWARVETATIGEEGQRQTNYATQPASYSIKIPSGLLSVHKTLHAHPVHLRTFGGKPCNIEPWSNDEDKQKVSNRDSTTSATNSLPRPLDYRCDDHPVTATVTTRLPQSRISNGIEIRTERHMKLLTLALSYRYIVNFAEIFPSQKNETIFPEIDLQSIEYGDNIDIFCYRTSSEFY
ncbi:hypothetical protein TNCV_2555841 [Trichonephila clavipes]|nr:hypothetical protein TNCV_2555841 [Trichonephila clavipes]